MTKAYKIFMTNFLRTAKNADFKEITDTINDRNEKLWTAPHIVDANILECYSMIYCKTRN